MSDVQLGEKVLDLGCGTGHFAAVLSELVGLKGEVVAVDPDGERIKIARKSFSRCNIEFLVANDQTFPGHQYGLVFCNYVIHRIKDKEALFKHLYEKLNPGGRFAFLTFNGVPQFPQNIVDFISEFAGPNFYQTLMYEQQVFETASTYRVLAESAGFVVTKLETNRFLSHWDSPEGLVTFFHGVSHGLLDMSTADVTAIQRFKEKNKCSVYKAPHELLYMIVTKYL